MANLPWFKLFASDYLLDEKIDAMPHEAEGLLVRMWCVCHREGSCPADPEALARKTLRDLQYVLQCKPHCEPFFELRGDKLFSRRMEQEKRRSDQARQNAKKRYEKKSKSGSQKSESESESESERGSAIGTATRTANGSAEIASPKNGDAISSSQAVASDQAMAAPAERQKTPPSEEARQLAELLKDEIFRYKPDYKPIKEGDLNRWAKTADLMIRSDGRTPERIAEVIRWVQHDEFNRAAVLSMGKLRKRFDELETRSRQKGGYGNGRRSLAEQAAESVAGAAELFDAKAEELERAFGGNVRGGRKASA